MLKENIKILFLGISFLSSNLLFAQQKSFSGIYPNLAMYNDEGECGTGAVVPWNDKLYVITYGPHLPIGSSDKLYIIDKSKKQHVRSEEHTSELQSRENLVCRLLLEKKKVKYS